MNYRGISNLLGNLLVGCSAFMATAVAWAAFADGSSAVITMLLSTAICAVVGAILKILGRGAAMTLEVREAFAIVALGWIAVSILGAVPFILEGVLPDPIDAFFEAASGFTTTGSTAITNLNICSKSLLYWRALTQWLGGMGIIVLFIAVFPQLGLGAKHMFRSEVPGPISEGLKPKIKQTALMLWGIYTGFTIAEIIALLLAGMNFHDSVCHTMTCMATGGFSPHNESIAFYQNPMIEILITFFMILAGINFSIYFLVLRGKFGQAFSNSEMKAYLCMLGGASLLIAINTWQMHQGILDKIIKPIFQVVSVATTTGFVSEDFDLYPAFSVLIMVLLMFIGGSAGSTGGGLKVVRIAIIVKAIYNNLCAAFQPHAVRVVKLGRQPVEESVVKEVLIFFVIYIFLFLLGTVIVALVIPPAPNQILTSFTASITCLSNVGPGFAEVGATQNFAFIPAGGKIILALLMIIGRLELFTVLVLFIPGFWKK